MTTKGSRTTRAKYKRRTPDEVEALRSAIEREVNAFHPMSLRQLYYVLVSRGIVPKTHPGYRAVLRAALQMRKSGRLPWEWVIDMTRWVRKPASFASVEDALSHLVDGYRRDLWVDQPLYVEVWVESNALAGVLYTITAELDVPLFAGHGYASATYLHEAGVQLMSIGKPAHIIYIGDWDPSGQDIERVIERDLREYSLGCDITFRRLAVTEKQISNWELPGKPPKATDARTKNFNGDTVEAEAVSPNALQAMLRDAIEALSNPVILVDTRRQEAEDRKVLRRLVDDLSR